MRDVVRRCMEKRAGRVIERRLSHGHGEPGRSRNQIIDNHRVGCAAEVAFRAWLGLDPNPDHETWRGGDVMGVEVRGTFARNGHLIIQDADPDDRNAVLVLLSESGGAIIRGWMPIAEAKGYPPRTAKGHAELDNHWVPCGDLRPMHDLPIEVPVRGD